jgi:asparagine synthetase B (glutamine-hydrolysing)
MLEFRSTLDNFYWDGDLFVSPVGPKDTTECFSILQTIQGQFSFALNTPEGLIFLVRDRLGINKLFFAIHQSGRIIASNSLIDLVRRGIPIEAIYSVPAGHFVEIDLRNRNLFVHRYFQLKSESEQKTFSITNAAQAIRQKIELWISRIKKQFGYKTILLCLSGGLDSGVIAAFARKYFDNVIAYTYGFCEEGEPQSEDVTYAVRLADFLRIPIRIVPASSADILRMLDIALCHGQDWRDFNVHCAVVNALLGEAMQTDARILKQNPLVLTGDLMNEFLADYMPVSYGGQQYYTLPNLEVGILRRMLIRGLDAGDREIGIFNHFGLQVIQPYGFLLDQYLRIPPSLLVEADFKQRLTKQIAGDLLPAFIFDRVKVRAQIGNSKQPTGILPLLIESGCNLDWMKNAFCQIFGIQDKSFLNRFIRTGVYRFIHEYPKGYETINGYYLP